jgi:ABC-type spermidine/putrescine transport system permease subunit I
MKPYFLAAPAALLALFTLGLPLVLLARVSLFEQGEGFYQPGTWSLESYRHFSGGQGAWLVANSVLFGVGVAVLSLAASFPLALWLRGLGRAERAWGLGLILLPRFASSLAVLFGLTLLLSSAGPLSTLLQGLGVVREPVMLARTRVGALLAESLLVIPYAVLFLHAHLSSIGTELEDAARGLGASWWQAFWRVTVPLALPGLLVAGELSLLWGMGALLGPVFLGSPEEMTLSAEAARQMLELGRWPRAAAAACVLALLAWGAHAALTRLRR